MMGRDARLSYTGGQLDRADAHRKDPAWIAAQAARPDTRFVVMHRDLHLVARAGAGEVTAALCETTVWSGPGEPEASAVFLGLDGDRPIFAADVSDADRDRVAALVAGSEFVDLRRVGALLRHPDAALLAYARAMLGWHRRHRFCGTCGSPTESRSGGHVRACTNPSCGAETFPRTDPAIIVLVEHPASGGEPARCLLARHSRIPSRMFSTLAGFVEPGESLEDAVVREVGEETGVRLESVTYQASQPWPFPSSLMVGFRATAATTTITLDPHELDEARWFSAADLARFGEHADESAEFRLPRRDSIARWLVGSWYEEVTGTPLGRAR